MARRQKPGPAEQDFRMFVGLLIFLLKLATMWWLWVWLLNRHRRPAAAAEVVRLAKADDFYRSPRWRKLRVKRISLNIAFYGRRTCEICMATRPNGAWHVHHIKSRSRYPELALDIDNTALCCEACNIGASNDYQDLELNPCARKHAA